MFDRARCSPARRRSSHGGSSGIGVTAIQMAKAWGATVIVTVGSAEKAAACRALGADHAIDYKTQDFVAEVLRLTGGKGTDVILDMVAGDYIGRDVKCLAEDGRIVIIAVQGGSQSTVDASLVLRRRLTITGSTLRPRPVAFKAQIAAALRKTAWPLARVGARQAGDPPGVPGRRGGARARADGIEPAHRQAGARVVAGAATPRAHRRARSSSSATGR